MTFMRFIQTSLTIGINKIASHFHTYTFLTRELYNIDISADNDVLFLNLCHFELLGRRRRNKKAIVDVCCFLLVKLNDFSFLTKKNSFKNNIYTLYNKVLLLN